MLGSVQNSARRALCAGICIAIAGTAFLSVGGILGAILFTAGLIVCVYYKIPLFTGTAGFIDLKMYTEYITMTDILVWNIVGAILVGVIVSGCSPMNFDDTLRLIVKARTSAGPLGCGVLSIGCGFVVHTAVKFAKEDKMLPLLFGVPLFIACGFPHSIADAFFLTAAVLELPEVGIETVILSYLTTIPGNFIGCNLPRILKIEK